MKTNGDERGRLAGVLVARALEQGKLAGVGGEEFAPLVDAGRELRNFGTKEEER